MPGTPKDAESLISEIIPASEVEKLEIGRAEEILQPLLDLGYIQIADESLIATGIRQFRTDYLAENLLPDFKPNFLFLPETELEAEELSLLHTLTALDGDFTLESLPELKKVSLCSRVIHYRISIHQLEKLLPDQPYSEKTSIALLRIRKWISNLPAKDLDLLNLLGDIPALMKHISINANGQLHKKIVVFKYQKNTQVSKFKVEVPEALHEEVTEDESEPESDNEISMLRLETEIDIELEDIQKALPAESSTSNFRTLDSKEKDLLATDTKKNKSKRIKMIKIQAMLEEVVAEQKRINDELNLEGAPITKDIKRLEKLQRNQENQKKILTAGIKQKDQLIKQLKKDKKKIPKLQRRIKRLKRKNASRSEIEAVVSQLNKLVQADRTIEKLEIEKSKLNVQLIPLEVDLNNTTKSLKTLRRQSDKLLEERMAVNSDKQKEILNLVDRLKRLKLKTDRLRFSFRGRMRKVLDREFYDNTVKKKVFQRRDRNTLEAFSKDDYNNYLIRLIQIYQWTNGYYYGKLDSEIGDRTFSAIDQFSNFSKGLRLKFIMARLSENHAGTSGYWILNIKYLFLKVTQILKDQNLEITTDDLLEKYEENFVDESGKAGKLGNEVTDKGYKEIVEENKEDIRESGLIRRIYYGVKGIACTLYHALLDLIQFIRRGIKKLIYLVKNLIKVVYKEIREGVRKFKDGMKFLFGKRTFATETSSGEPILTKFDFDFDALTIGPEKVSKQEYLLHNQQLNRFSNNLDFTMVITGKVLKWVFRLIQLGTPIGWARLAIKIAFYFKREILKWLIGLGKKMSQTFFKVKYTIKKEVELV